MLDNKTIEIVKSTVPYLKEHGTELTGKFYEILFKKYPQVQPMFDMEKQKSGEQPANLARSILAAAENIENLPKILPAVESIGKTHVAKKVLPEQYPVVGQTLLEAMKVLLGDAATDELLDAWGKAYAEIAKVFIDVEGKMYASQK